MKSGFFVVFEGIDGSGTTTQLGAVSERLVAAGYRVHTTCEPSSGPIGRFLRQILTRSLRAEDGEPYSFDWQTMALLFAADRKDHIEREVRPACARGEIVISDRYLLSSLAYQSATASDPSAALEFVRAANQAVAPPDLMIVFDVDPDVARARRKARGGPDELFERDELQRRLAALYRSSEELDPIARTVHVDAHLPIDDLSDLLTELIVRELQSWPGGAELGDR
jgi:dTMP kinase